MRLRKNKEEFTPRLDVFAKPERLLSLLRDIYLLEIGLTYPKTLPIYEDCQNLLLAIEAFVGINNSKIIGAFQVPENVKIRLITLYQQLFEEAYITTRTAVPEDLLGILDNIKTTFGTFPVYGHWKLNELSGTNAQDTSYHHRHGTLMNMEDADWQAGKLNNCLRFEGINEYVDLGNIASFERTDSFSVEFWFNSTQVDIGMFIAKEENIGNYRGLATFLDFGSVSFMLSNNSPGGINVLRVKTTNIFNDGNWHHVVITYAGTSIPSGVHIFVDNIDEPLSTVWNTLTDTIVNSVNLRFGTRDGNGRAYIGKLDEVVIYTRVLTILEIAYRYNAGNGKEVFNF